MNMTLDPRLAADTHPLGRLDDCLLLIAKNALFPWFILVPETQEIEFYKLDSQQQGRLQQHINAVSGFIEGYFSTDKINIASIGNIVSQLHIHVIGRRQDDACWPGVVWGTSQFKAYEKPTLDAIKSRLGPALGDSFRPAEDVG
ncbi:MAG: HIT family protein [Gammaproteobacteria bacterium]|nr:HIT family protein [Gammaproteobacteria bacterium]